jgi:membrane protein
MSPLAPPLSRTAPAHKRAARVALRIAQGLRRHNAQGAAPAMAFHFFLSLVPVLVLVGFVLGLVVRQRGVDALLGPAIEATPDAAEQIIRAELERLAGANAATIAPLSVLGFLWLAAAGIHGLMDELEVIAAAPPRPWWRKRLLAHAWVAGALAALAVLGWGALKVDGLVHREPVATHIATDAPHGSASRTAAGAAHPKDRDRAERDPATREAASSSAHHSHTPLPLLRDTWERLAILAAFALIALAGLATFYRVSVAHPPGVRRRVWPGALLAFAAWLVVSWGFGAYVGSLGRYALFYGSVAAVAVLLMWFYFTSWSLLIGAELNAQLEGLRD